MRDRADELGEPRPMRESDVDRCALAIARAFSWHEPFGPWVFPDEETREPRLRSLVEADLRERFLAHGRCSTIAAACATMWVPPSSHPGARAFANRRGDYGPYGERGAALRAGDELLTALRPAGEHWYLDTIATEPELMGRGLGGRLLDHDLARLDAAGQSAALETHTAENVAFYERRGFAVVASGRLPDGGPEVHVMVRPART